MERNSRFRPLKDTLHPSRIRPLIGFLGNTYSEDVTPEYAREFTGAFLFMILTDEHAMDFVTNNLLPEEQMRLLSVLEKGGLGKEEIVTHERDETGNVFSVLKREFSKKNTSERNNRADKIR